VDLRHQWKRRDTQSRLMQCYQLIYSAPFGGLVSNSSRMTQGLATCIKDDCATNHMLITIRKILILKYVSK